MQDFVTILSNFGFPVAVASYLLFRFEKKLEILEQSNRDLVQSNGLLVAEVKSLRQLIESKKTI